MWVWFGIKELGLVPFTKVPFGYMFLSHSHVGRFCLSSLPLFGTTTPQRLRLTPLTLQA